MNVQLVVNGQKFPLHYRHLRAIAANLPHGVRIKELAKAIAGLGVPSVTKSLMSSWVLWDHEVLDELWADGDPNIRRNLVANFDFVRQLTDSQALDIIDADDPAMLELIAGYAFLRYPPFRKKGEFQEARLSSIMADALLEHISSSRYPKVRQMLAKNFFAPRKSRPAFRECVQSGFDAIEAFSTIQPEDIELLKTESFEALQYIATHVEDIEDEAAQLGVIKLLRSHPDPAVRLALAQNAQAPTLAFRFLARDAETDVRLAARKPLRAQGYVFIDEYDDFDGSMGTTKTNH